MRVILIIEIENLRILYVVNVKSPQITNSRKSKHAKITRSTIYIVNLPSAEYTRLPNTHVSRLPSASASAEYTKPFQVVLCLCFTLSRCPNEYWSALQVLVILCITRVKRSACYIGLGPVYIGPIHLIWILEKGTWRFGRAPDCIASHACVLCSSPAFKSCVGFSDKYPCFSLLNVTRRSR